MKKEFPSVFFWSFKQESPRGFGMVPLGSGTMIRLTPVGLVEGYALGWDKPTGRCYTYNRFSRPVDWWEINHRQVRDIRLKSLIVDMQKTGNSKVGPVSEHLPLPALLAEVDPSHHIDLDSTAARDLILWVIGPEYEGAATPGVASITGGTVVEFGQLHDGSGRKFVGFDTGEAFSFPVSSRIYPWVQQGVRIDPGVAMADMVPRVHYTWDQFMAFGDHVVSQVVDDVVESSTYVEDGKSFVDFRLVPDNYRSCVTRGGYVKSIVEVVDENRQPQLVATDTCSDEIGDYNFATGFTRNRVLSKA